MTKIKVVLFSTTMFLPSVMSLSTQNIYATSTVDKHGAYEALDQKIISSINQYRRSNINAKEKYLKAKNILHNNESYWANTSTWQSSLENLDKLHYFAKYKSKNHTQRMENIMKSIVTVINNDFNTAISSNNSLSVDDYLMNANARNNVLGLVNGLLVGEALYKKINDPSSSKNYAENAQKWFGKIVNETMLKLQRQYIELRGPKLELAYVVKKIAQEQSNKEHDFIHDMRCYLEQFWYICDGEDEKGKLIESVVSKVQSAIDDKSNLKNNKALPKYQNLINEVGNVAENSGVPPPANEQVGTALELISKVEDHVDQSTGKLINGDGLKKLSAQDLKRLEHLYRDSSDPKIKNVDKANIVNAYQILKNNINAKQCGLKNQGVTCYLNATLQAFASQREFLKRLLSTMSHKYNWLVDKQKKNNDKNSTEYLDIEFVFEFIKTMCYMIQNPTVKNYAPEELLIKLSRASGIAFEEQKNGGDSKDVFDNCVRILHSVLKNDPKPNVPINVQQNTSKKMDERSKAFYTTINNLAKEDNSVISDFFFSVDEGVTTCPKGHSSYLFQTPSFHSYPLIEVFKTKYNHNLMSYVESVREKLCDANPVSLYDCLQWECRPLNLGNMYCGTCKKEISPCSRVEHLGSGSKLLTIMFNRGKGLDAGVRVRIPEIISDLGTYCTIDKTSFYYLSSVTCWSPSGHYTTFSRTAPDSSWYWYDDNRVHDLSDSKESPIYGWFRNMLNGGKVAWYPTIVCYTRLEPKAQEPSQELMLRRKKILLDFNNVISGNAKEIKEIIKNTKYTANKVGIKNIGSTCYMNAVLQCLFNIIPFRVQVIKQYDKWQNKKVELGDEQMFKSLSTFFYDLQENQNTTGKTYDPRYFHNALSLCNSQFAELRSNDSKDLLIYLLQSANEALSDNQQKLPIPRNVDQSDKIASLEFNLITTGALNDTCVRQLFHSKLCSETTCCACNRKTYNIQDSQVYMFNAYKDLKQTLKRNELYLKDYLEDIVQPEKMTGQNQCYCKGCCKLQDAQIVTRFYYGAPVVVFNINYGKNKEYEKNVVGLRIPMDLDMQNFVEVGKNDSQYFLSGMIVHLGSSGESGHFITLCRTTPRGDWYAYSDSSVIQLTEKGKWKKSLDESIKMLTQNIEGGDFTAAKDVSPYFMIYQKKSLYNTNAKIDQETIPVDENLKKLNEKLNEMNKQVMNTNIQNNQNNMNRTNQINNQVVIKQNNVNLFWNANNNVQNNMNMNNNVGVGNINNGFVNNLGAFNPMLNNQMNAQMAINNNNVINKQMFPPVSNNFQNNLNQNAGYQYIPMGNPGYSNPNSINYNMGNNIINVNNNVQNNMNTNNNINNIKNGSDSRNNNLGPANMTGPLTFDGKCKKLKLGLENSMRLFYSTPKGTVTTKALRGLANVGATCYMNATLQCFLNNTELMSKLMCMIHSYPEFAKWKGQEGDQYRLSGSLVQTALNAYNFDPEKILGTNNNITVKGNFKIHDMGNTIKVGDEYKKVVDIWKSYDGKDLNEFYAPYQFKNTISAMNDLFKGVQANDSKDLINFMIMTMHDELNKAKNQAPNNDMIVNQTNRNAAFSAFAKDFENKNKSVISDLFYAVNVNTTKCGGCNVTLYNYQTYFFLITPLEEVRKFAQQNTAPLYPLYGISMLNPLDKVSLYDCFNYEQRITTMNGQNAMYCNYCKATWPAYMQTRLVTGPETLIIILNRGKGIEFNVKCTFPQFLDLRNYIEHRETGTQYKLTGVVTHMGENNMSGHFIAQCLASDGQWYEYNDAMVKPIEDFEKKVIDYAMPYILFYQKIH